jgi:hypothetical protein
MRQFLPLRKNRSVRFGFGGATVLLACRGWQVSFYTTEGGNGDGVSQSDFILILNAIFWSYGLFCR